MRTTLFTAIATVATATALLIAGPAFAGELINNEDKNTNINVPISLSNQNQEQEQTTITKAGAASKSAASSPNNLNNEYKTRANALGVSLQRNPVQPGRTNPNVFGSPEQSFSMELGPLYSQSRTGPASCMMSGTAAAAAMSLTLAQTVSNYYGMNNPGVKAYWEEADKQTGYAIQYCVNSDQ